MSKKYVGQYSREERLRLMFRQSRCVNERFNIGGREKVKNYAPRPITLAKVRLLDKKEPT